MAVVNVEKMHWIMGALPSCVEVTAVFAAPVSTLALSRLLLSLSSSSSLLQHSVISQAVVTNVSNHFFHSTSSPSVVESLVDEALRVVTTSTLS